jgi:glycosyltransferase involved in cell wall biosynthesis
VPIEITLNHSRQKISILTNFNRMDGARGRRFIAQSKWTGDDHSVVAIARLFKDALNCDLVVLNTDSRRLMFLCLMKALLPFWKISLVSVDIHLSEPKTLRDKFIALAKRLLLRNVDRFILYFKDCEAYARYYGINPDRVSYVPFKVNEWECLPSRESLSSDGLYILTAGRGLRDLPTFVEAMRQVPYPAVLLYQKSDVMRAYGTDLKVKDLPPNIKMVLHDGDKTTWIDHIARAKVVVIPALDSIRPVGISLYLLAMALKKAVVITDGPATRGLIEGRAAIVPVGDAKAMARAIESVWADDGLRDKMADAGRLYAEGLEGEQRLLGDIVDICGELVSKSDGTSGKS